MESISSAVGSDSTTNAVPISSPRCGSATAGRAAASAISRICIASAPAAYVCRSICAASKAIDTSVNVLAIRPSDDSTIRRSDGSTI